MPINYGMNQLRNSMANGARGPLEGPQGMSLEMRRGLAGGGGNTAGLAANPARNGNPSPKGTGSGLVPNTLMTTHEGAVAHAMHIGKVQKAMAAGQVDHAWGHQQLRQSQAYLDRHAEQKRAAAVKSSKPRVKGPGFGSFSDGNDDVNMSSLLTDGRQSDVPGGSAMGTTRSPFSQGNQSGGGSAVPNSSFMPGGRRGPGY